MPEIVPKEAPDPRSLLGYDGTNFYVLKVDSDGRLHVRGEDQLFTYKGRLASHRRGIISGADGFYDSNSPPAGEIWVVTNVAAYDRITATTSHAYYTPEGVDLIAFRRQTEAFGIGIFSEYHGLVYLEEGDVVRVHFTGALAGDDCVVQLTGQIMTLET